MLPPTVVCVVGTRPEAIKMAPVIRHLLAASWTRCRVLVAGQHRELLHQALAFFDIRADVDLDVMVAGQSLAELTARLITRLDHVWAGASPDLVLAQGDTTTVLAAALTCFYRRIPFGHVEAGLRTGHLDNPFPEEANRLLVARLAQLHFAPTAGARDRLLREGISPHMVHVTGNPVVDALHIAVRGGLASRGPLAPGRRLILVTAHRRESHGQPLQNICQAIALLQARHADVQFLWPLHPNPAVQSTVQRMLGTLARVRVCAPLSYGDFVLALQECHLVLTDSGGIQEEAPALGKPVLVLRDESERPEAIDAGVARLVGTCTKRIVEEVDRLLNDTAAYRRMAVGASPYGDGRAAERIGAVVRQFLKPADRADLATINAPAA